MATSQTFSQFIELLAATLRVPPMLAPGRLGGGNARIAAGKDSLRITAPGAILAAVRRGQSVFASTSPPQRRRAGIGR